jgi:hypothetical protein
MLSAIQPFRNNLGTYNAAQEVPKLSTTMLNNRICDTLCHIATICTAPYAQAQAQLTESYFEQELHHAGL